MRRRIVNENVLSWILAVAAGCFALNHLLEAVDTVLMWRRERLDYGAAGRLGPVAHEETER
jgi:hypothetical protein